MQNNIQIIQIMYEIAMSVGKSLNMQEMLKHSLLTYLRKLNCSAGIVYSHTDNGNNTYNIERIFTVPFILDAESTYPEITKIISESNKNNKPIPKTLKIGTDIFCHIMTLKEFGYIVLMKNSKPLEDYIIHNLIEINTKLAQSCIACINNTNLIESENKFHSILDNMNDAIWSISYPEMKLIYFNKIAEYIYGNIKDNFSLDLIKKITHPQDKHLIDEAMDKLIKDGFVEQEFRIIKPDGNIIWVYDRAILIFDENNKPIRIDGLARDVTDKKLSEEKINQNLKDNIFISSLSLNLSDYQAKDKLINNILTSIKQHTGAHFVCYSEYIEDKKILKPIHYLIDKGLLNTISKISGNKIFLTETPISEEVLNWILTSETEIVYSLTEASMGAIPGAIDKAIRKATGLDKFCGIAHISSGKLLGTTLLAFKKEKTEPQLGLIKNYANVVTLSLLRNSFENELRESEEQHRTLVSNVPGIIFRCINDPDWTMLFITDDIQDISGYPADDFINNKKRTFASIIHPEDQDLVYKIINEFRYDNSKAYKVTYRIIDSEGKIKWFYENSIITKNNPKYNGKEIIDGVIMDITAQKQAELSLIDSEKHYRLIADNSNDVIWTTDGEGKIKYISPSVKKLKGFTPEEIKNQKLEDAFTEESLELYLKSIEDIKQISKSEKKFSSKLIKLEHITKCGNTVWTESTFSGMYDDNNDFIGILGVTRDISERLKVEKEIENYSKMQALLIKISNQFINIEEDKIDDVINNSLKEIGLFVGADRSYIFDYDWENDVCNNTYEWCAEGIEPQINELQGVPLEMIPYWVDTHKKGETMNIKDVFALPENDGVRIILEPQNVKSLITIPMFEANKCIGFIGFDMVLKHHTFTDKEKSLLFVYANMLVNMKNRVDSYYLLLRQYDKQKFLASISTDFVSANIDNIDKKINSFVKKVGQFFNVNRSYIFLYCEEQKYFKYTYRWCSKGVELFNETIKTLNAENYKWWNKELQKNKTIYIPDIEELPEEASQEKKLLRNFKIKSLLSIPIISNDNVIGFWGFDSTEEKKIWKKTQIEYLNVLVNILSESFTKINFERKLIKTVEIAEAASQAKSQFLSNMSHEIRTPLSGVIGFSELLKETSLNQIQLQYVNNTIVSANSLSSIINDILDFSKIEAGKLELENKKTNIFSLVEEATDIIKYDAEKKHLELLLNIHNQTPRFILSDSVRLKQILVNLLSNAVKFTDKGEVELKLDFTKINDTKGKFHFSVVDTGIGIKKEQEKLLFKAFSQVDTSSVRKYGGTGLGLVISNLIAEKMDSKIEFESEPNKGSNFYFTIEAEYFDEDKPNLRFLRKIKKVLVIDDNEKNRLVLKNKFENWGIKFVGSENEAETMKIIEKTKNFNAIIVDYNMPDMNGVEIIKQIKNKLGKLFQKQNIILMINSADTHKVQEDCYLLGVSSKIIKPVKTDDLLDSLKKIKNLTINQDNEVITNQLTEDSLNLRDFSPVVLIAEDVPTNMFLIKSMVKNLFNNVEIIEADNGKKVLDFLKDCSPDIIIMDIQMPELDGIKTTEIIRSLGKQIPIIALTAGVLKEDKEKCISVGMNEFLSKPLKKDELIKIMKKYLPNYNIEQ